MPSSFGSSTTSSGFKLEVRKFEIFRRLDTPQKIQDFLDTLPINFEKGGDTCRSPLETLTAGEAHCMEGAVLAAAILWYNGRPPVLLDLKTIKGDDYHVVALFKQGGLWGAISKTNHAVLRYRDPIFRNVRELALSYFNEYFLDNGKKTLRSYSGPFSLLSYNDDWLTTEDNLWNLNDDLDQSPHFNILQNIKTKDLRKADPIEIKSGKLTEWRKK